MIRSTVLISALLIPMALFAQAPREVRDADNPARQPFACSYPWNTTTFVGPGVVSGFCTVPAHKRLVIENVNANMIIGFPVWALTVSVTTNGTARQFTYPVMMGGVPSTTTATNIWITSESVRLYADPGSNVSLTFKVGSGTGSPGEFAVFNLSGYLVDVP